MPSDDTLKRTLESVLEAVARIEQMGLETRNAVQNIEVNLNETREQVRNLDSKYEVTAEQVRHLAMKLEEIGEQVQNLNTKIDATQEDVRTLRTDVNKLKEDVFYIRAAQKEFELEMRGLRGDFNRHRMEFSEERSIITFRLDNFKERFEKLENAFQETKAVVMNAADKFAGDYTDFRIEQTAIDGTLARHDEILACLQTEVVKLKERAVAQIG